MDNLSPSRIESISPGEAKDADDPRPPSSKHSRPKQLPASPPPVDLEIEEEEQHHLDERA